MAAGGETEAPSPRSPPKYPDFCGRRRLQLEVQILTREVGFLEEELQSIERLQPVSRCCKEVHEFVGTNSDPLIPPNKKSRGSCQFWKWLGSKLCHCLSCICCCAGSSCCECKMPSCRCCPHPKKPCCSNCSCGCLRCCYPEVSCCRLPRSCCSCKPCSCCKWPSCCSWNHCRCKPPKCCSCRGVSCCKMPKCCCSPTISCPEYSCGCVFDCPKCTEVHLCPRRSRPCCVTGCLC